jgi:UDP-N-acetylglucosamine--N-acetylmuramyl-(pentapeptide) pyrophosphoryl-undecaprenol N-acetylglucosamine transferase
MSTLLVASTGGHLAELYQLRAQVVPPGERVVWATFDSAQSRSMLQGEQVEYVPYTSPRDLRRVISTVPRAAGILRRHSVDCVVSTGSAIALSFIPLARAMGLRAHYIESAARSDGPSTTGRLLERIPGVLLSTQYRSWARDRWHYSVSVFDQFRATERLTERPHVRSIVVTVGTMTKYGFRSLVERVLAIAPPGVQIVWQTGVTDLRGLGVDGRQSMAQDELHAHIADADAVIAHAGIGSALAALSAGHRPILIPRSAARGEHVDDHQQQIARELRGLGLAAYREVDDLTWDDVEDAARYRTSRDGQAPRLA